MIEQLLDGGQFFFVRFEAVERRLVLSHNCNATSIIGSDNLKDTMMNVLKQLLRPIVSIVRFVMCTLGDAARPIASSDDPYSAEDVVGTATNIGVLNYRTERLDNGTDPYGWYN